MDIAAIREEFPILHQTVNNSPLVYFDNAATTHCPKFVTETSRNYFETINSNIHRGVHFLSRLATDTHEQARETIARHLNVSKPEEIIFTSGTTDSINLVAQSLSLSPRSLERKRILITQLEHHSNIVPWQQLCERIGGTLDIIPISPQGELILDDLESLLTSNTLIVALNHVSNALGTINPIDQVITQAKKVGALSLIDGAQALPHQKIDIQSIGSDFYCFSGHKAYGPTGIGVLWGKSDLLNELPPWRGGGEMIKEVTFEKTTYNEIPFKFEAGTPHIEGAISLAAAIEWMNSIGMDSIFQHEKQLLSLATEQLQAIEGLKIYGESPHKAGVISFLIDGIHHFDLGTLMDQMGFALRSGHHCCQPLMQFFGITGTLRASFAIYNTEEEVERLTYSIKKACAMLR